MELATSKILYKGLGAIIMKKTIDVNELENFLWYLQDKSDDVYQSETKRAVDRFLENLKDYP